MTASIYSIVWCLSAFCTRRDLCVRAPMIYVFNQLSIIKLNIAGPTDLRWFCRLNLLTFSSFGSDNVFVMVSSIQNLFIQSSSANVHMCVR